MTPNITGSGASWAGSAYRFRPDMHSADQSIGTILSQTTLDKVAAVITRESASFNASNPKTDYCALYDADTVTGVEALSSFKKRPCLANNGVQDVTTNTVSVYGFDHFTNPQIQAY